jgi:SnoaL-like domain
MASRDWDEWARKAERAIDVANRGDWKGLFAPGATFADPATDGTDDLRKIAHDTKAMFPDWTQEITSIRGGDDWAVFEWIGRATYAGPGTAPGAGAGVPIEMRGATIVEVDTDGLVTSWRDYLDRKEPEEQIRAALRARAAPQSGE